MPHFQSNRNNNSQQRRVFRGRGGPTDGNIPPKKTSRPKVKYQPNNNNEANNNDQGQGDVLGVRHAPLGEELPTSNENNQEHDYFIATNINRLSLHTIDVGEAEEEIISIDPFQQEINHLHKRIQNVQLSLQTSQGICNPQTWNRNCLVLICNVVKEWRSILKFHLFVDDDADANNKYSSRNNEGCGEDNGVAEQRNIVNDATNNDNQSSHGGTNSNNAIINEHKDDNIHNTAQKVFGLIQMALQSGPLVGSNPGYFKRCGGEVALMAFEFMGDIMEFADVDATADGKSAGGERRKDCNTADNKSTVGADYDVVDCVEEDDLNNPPKDNCKGDQQDEGGEHEFVRGTRADDDEDSTTSSSDHSTESSTSSSNQAQQQHTQSNLKGDEETKARSNIAEVAQHTRTMSNIQTNLLFTEKQSQRFCTWYRNAQKAIAKNAPPSKSAKKLQSEKSKKQKQKELKMQRKLKKSKKRGGG